MTKTTDAFAHHPELRDQIAPSETSMFRTFSIDNVIRQHPEMERFRPWAHSDAKREAIRAETLRNHQGDLWVFAYGSLMWDPALRFQDVRRVRAQDHARRFILKDEKGGRGTEDAPGLMAALDDGAGCDGLAYRIAADAVETETEILFRREMIGPGYLARFIPVSMGGTALKALTFVADHGSDEMVPDIARPDQIRWIATGAGFLGTSYDYLSNILSQLTRLGIDDRDCRALLHDVDAYRGVIATSEVE